MPSLDLSALKELSANNGIAENEFQETAKLLPEFLEKIRNRDQGFHTDAVLRDDSLIDEILAFAESARKKYRFIVLLGIGGSALGPIALKEAFSDFFENPSPEVIVLDNIDPDLIASVEAHIDLATTLFLVVTKSGGTPETLSQYYYFQEKIVKAGFPVQEHFCFVTDPEKGLLRVDAKKYGIRAFPVPPNVGGRFSVLTSVGLLPAALLGIDIRALLNGALAMREHFYRKDFQENFPFRLAALLHLFATHGKRNLVLYPYSQKLFRLADWCRQLIAESTGKRFTESGKEVFAGITPVAALGATDQHSQNQLYFEGPNDKFFIFFEVERFNNLLPIPLPADADESTHYLHNTDFGTLLNLEKAGTAGALSKADRPHITLRFHEINAFEIGGFFMLFEGATAFMGEFLGINAFDQPGVELSKNITRELLLKRG